MVRQVSSVAFLRRTVRSIAKEKAMTDRYTKIILTVIAVALTAWVLQLQFTNRPVQASDEGWQLKAVPQKGLYVFERCE